MDKQKVTLVICDGFGLSELQKGNAITEASTPTIDYLFQNYPAIRLLAAGPEVGLDLGEPGNSEVGHLAIGTGQVIPQAMQVISAAIKSDAYKTNKVLLTAFDQLNHNREATLHFVGIVSGGGVHGHIDHLLALMEFAHKKGVKNVAVHALTDGRDTPPKVALEDGPKIEKDLKRFAFGVIATVGGRWFGMDRDHNWQRTDAFYWAMMGKSHYQSSSFKEAVQSAYDRGESDENMAPTTIVDKSGEPLATMKDGDVVIFFNFRPDRIRQLTTRILMTDVKLTVVTMTDYFLSDKPPISPGTTMSVAFPLPKPKDTLADMLAEHGKTQLHLAETEKYAHVTYFFDGHQEVKHSGEDWLMIPSPKVDSFDRAPEMSAAGVTAAYLNAMKQHPYDFVVINYANMDMVGHSGNFKATCEAVTCVDEQLKKLVDWCEAHDSWLLITADHGNAESKIDPVTGEIDKEHTINPVPLFLVHPNLKKARNMSKQRIAELSQAGMLADIAPTILEIFGIRQPREMAGESLLKILKG